MLRRIGKQSRESVEPVLEKRKATVGRICTAEKEGFKPCVTDFSVLSSYRLTA